MTDHREIERLLPGYAAGEIQGAEKRRIEEHLAGCGDCAGWVATYHETEVALAADTAGHPSADELAREALGSEEDARVRRHLAACDSCRREFEWIGGAVAAARSPEAGFALEEAGRVRRAGWRLAAAAALFVVLATVVALANRPTGESVARSRSLEGMLLEGRSVVVAEESLSAQHTEIAAGAEVTMRAGSVVLGEGFSVGDQATLTVETPSASPRGKAPHGS